jgi:hypothetical protein
MPVWCARTASWSADPPLGPWQGAREMKLGSVPASSSWRGLGTGVSEGRCGCEGCSWGRSPPPAAGQGGGVRGRAGVGDVRKGRGRQQEWKGRPGIIGCCRRGGGKGQGREAGASIVGPRGRRQRGRGGPVPGAGRREALTSLAMSRRHLEAASMSGVSFEVGSCHERTEWRSAAAPRARRRCCCHRCSASCGVWRISVGGKGGWRGAGRGGEGPAAGPVGGSAAGDEPGSALARPNGQCAGGHPLARGAHREPGRVVALRCRVDLLWD